MRKVGLGNIVEIAVAVTVELFTRTTILVYPTSSSIGLELPQDQYPSTSSIFPIVMNIFLHYLDLLLPL